VKKILMFLVMAVILALVGLRLYEELLPASTSSSDANGMVQRPTMLVETATAQPHVFLSELQILGELAPKASVAVMSRVSGRLREVLVERGDIVQSGQLLAVVDDENLLQQIQRAEASIAVARAGVSREEASRDNLEIQVQRFQRLHNESLISTQELQDMESRLRAATAQVELARAQVEQAEASLRDLKIQQDQTRVYSPLDGFAGTRYLDPGALVNPSVPIVSVIDVSRVKTVVPVPEGVLFEMRVGLSAKVTVDAFPGRTYHGRVPRISPFLDPNTRTADIEIEIANESGQLRPGMFARVSIESSKPQAVLAIPRAALLTRGNDKGVFLLDQDSLTRYRSISIGRIQNDWVEVLDGLEEGTQVVTSGAQKLNDGDKVRIG